MRRLLGDEYVHVELVGVKSESPGYVICANTEMNDIPVGLWACTPAVVAGLAHYHDNEAGRHAVKKYLRTLMAGRDDAEVESLTKPAAMPSRLADYWV